MATEIFIHKMTEHMETARIIRWLVKEGDTVERNQVLMEVETDKAVVELEAPAAGVIKGVRADAVEGAEVKVGEAIAYITRPDENPPLNPAGERSPTSASAQTAPASQPASVPTGQGADGDVRATPLARKLARELGVELSLLSGSGPRGIIRDEDVRVYQQQSIQAVAPQGGEPARHGAGQVTLNPIQALTGARMLQSVQTAPQFSLTLEADMTNALWLQRALAEKIMAATGCKLTLTALLVKIAAKALKAHPYANASFENGMVRLESAVNIGVAVGSDQGLVVPVIRQVDACSLEQVVEALDAFSEKAKVMRFAVDDLQGGTFTLSNLGMYGILQFNAILNPPQSAILAVGKVVKRAVELEDGSLGLHPMISLTLTVDHRVMDGLKGALFLAELKDSLENPYFLL